MRTKSLPCHLQTFPAAQQRVDKHPPALWILGVTSCLWGGLQSKGIAQYRKEVVCQPPKLSAEDNCR